MIKIKARVSKFFNAGKVYAHCDVPCGIYTTHRAGIAAETVEKMVQKITELARPADNANSAMWQTYNNSIARFIAVKEEWAQICKSELWILWSDYFKAEHLKNFPDLHNIFWKATKLCSQNKREINSEASHQLRKAINEINAIFIKIEAAKASKYRQQWL